MEISITELRKRLLEMVKGVKVVSGKDGAYGKVSIHLKDGNATVVETNIQERVKKH